jgi:UMF1 family MFS transporter
VTGGAAASPSTDDGYRDRPRVVGSWALYDFANTIFSALVVTAYAPKVLRAATGSELAMGLAGAGSLLLAALVGPFMGALADATGRAKSLLLAWSAVCCIGAAGLALVPLEAPGLFLAVFVLSNLAYNTALSLYDAFLPDIASPHRMGYVSGVGVGVGYAGALVAFPAGYLATEAFGDRAGFLVAGLLMAVFTIPFAVAIRERRSGAEERFTLALGTREFRVAWATIRSLPGRPALALFLAGNFLAVDSLNAMIQWVGQFARFEWGLDEKGVMGLLVGISVSGIAFGFVLGRVADLFGARAVLLAAVGALGVVSLVDALAPDSARGVAVGVTVFGGGVGAAGTWLAGRRMLVDMAPPERLGEYMGLLGLTRKASVIGTVTLGWIASEHSWRLAIAALAVPLLLGGWMVHAATRAPRGSR